MQVVGAAESRQAVGALLEFVPHAKAPLRCMRCGLAQRRQLQASRIVSANHHGEGVFEAERLGNSDAVTRCVKRPHGTEHSLWIPIDRLLENCGERRARVFHIRINAPGDEGLVADVAAGKVEPPERSKVKELTKRR
jgi:hypothetical protein